MKAHILKTALFAALAEAQASTAAIQGKVPDSSAVALCYFGVRVVFIILAALELVALEGNRNDDGWSFRHLRGKTFEPEDFSHATEVDKSVGARSERDHVFDGTVDFYGLLSDKQDPTRTDVPGGSRRRDLVGTCPDDFHRKFHLKPLVSALLNHAFESSCFPLESQ
jgi:hypothetical protein